MTSVAEDLPRPLPLSGPRARAGRWVAALAALCGLLLVAATAEIVLDGALDHSPLIPKSPAIAGWLSGAGERLGYRAFLIALLTSVAAYLVLLALAGRARLAADRRSGRWAIGLVVALHAIVFAGPILISTDVFSYIAYARMGVVHGINPYLHGPASILGDPVYRYVGKSWKHVATAYGPLYTLLSYPLAPLGVKGALWGMKLMALLFSAGTLALTWRCARLRDLNPVFALLAVGANPLYVIYGLGGAHNDLLMTLCMMAAVALMLSTAPVAAGRQAWAGALVVAGALVKATAAVLLPFMVLARHKPTGDGEGPDRSRETRASGANPRFGQPAYGRLRHPPGPVLGAALAAALSALVAYVAFGIHGVNIVSALNRNAAFVSTDSFPTEVAHLFGKPGVFPIDHTLLKGALVAILLYLMWLTWRGYDWVAASGWALLAIAVTSTWLLAWYTLWSLPLAVVSRDRRLLVATLAVQALFIAHQTSPLFAQVQ